MCTSFMQQVLVGEHQLGTATLVSRTSLTAPTTDTLKAALYLASATKNASTTVYNTTGEVSGTGYTAGGVTVTNATAPQSTNSSSTAGTAYWTPTASLTYSTVTLATAFDCVVLYNSTQSNKAISVHTFGSQTITAGTFTLTMPANTTAAALLRLTTF
jgi:hypothetical protein